MISPTWWTRRPKQVGERRFPPVGRGSDAVVPAPRMEIRWFRPQDGAVRATGSRG